MIEFYWIKASIFLFPTTMGGKSWDIKDGYHPNLIWGFNESINKIMDEGKLIIENCHEFNAKSIDGLFLFGEGDKELGSFFHTKIRMGKEKWFEDYIQIGNHFLIREGRKIVGFGIMLNECSPIE